LPGLYGHLSKNGVQSSEKKANAFLNLLRHDNSFFSGKCFCNKYGYQGVVDEEHDLQHDWIVSNEKIIMVYGDVYSYKNSGFVCEKAKTVLSLYESGQTEFLKNLSGSYLISIYDMEKKDFILANDRFGSKNIFYCVSDGDFLQYSSEMKTILGDTNAKPKLDREAIVEFLTFSHMFDNKTFFQDIKLLPPGSAIIYNLETSTIQIKRYWDFEFTHDRAARTTESYLVEFDSLIKKAIKKRIVNRNKIGVFLSGGLDSRLLLGYTKRIADAQGKTVVSFTFGTRNGWQESIAKKIAEDLGVENRFYEIPSDCIAKSAEEIVFKGDGHIRIRDSHFVSLLREIRNSVDTFLVGFFAGTAFGAHIPPSIGLVSNKNELVNLLYATNEVRRVSQHISKLFLDDFFKEDLKKKAANFLRIKVNEMPEKSWEEFAHYWDLKQRGVRYQLLLSSYLGWYIHSSDVYLDNELVDFAWSLPIDLKIGKRFLRYALVHFLPNLARIPDENTGALPNDSRLMVRFSLGKRLLKNLMYNAIEKLSLGRILFVPKDYRAYDYWLRTGSRKYVEKVLMKDSQDIFNQAYVDKILKEHMACKQNNDQIICDILNLKLLLKKTKARISNYSAME